MRITAIATGRRRVPLRWPFQTSLRRVTEVEAVTVSVTVGRERAGYAEVVGTPPITGETSLSIEDAINTHLAPRLVGRPFGSRGDLDELLALLPRAIAANTTAKCALDVALHRALAAQGAMVLGQLWGAAPAAVRTDVTISLGPPAAMAEAATRRSGQGFSVLKLKLGGPPAVDVERVRAVATAVPDGTVLRLDANQAWSAGQSVAVLEALERSGTAVEFVEQPVLGRDTRAMAIVAAASPFPVMADESAHDAEDVRRLADAGACHLVNIKLAKCGGLAAARDMARAAGAAGLGVMVGSMMETAWGVSASTVLAAHLAPGTVHDLDAAWWVRPEGPVRYRPPLLDCAEAPTVPDSSGSEQPNQGISAGPGALDAPSPG